MSEEKPFAYICTLMHNQERVQNVHHNIIPFLEEGHYNIWPAIDGMSHALEKFETIHNLIIHITKDRERNTRARKALIYSAIDILEDGLKHHPDGFIFFEDDVKLKPNFYDNFSKLILDLPEDADMLRFYSAHMDLTHSLLEKDNISPLKQCEDKKWFGTDCLYFSQKGIKNVLECLKKTEAPLDLAFCECSTSDALHFYISNTNAIASHFHYGMPSTLDIEAEEIPPGDKSERSI